MSKYPNWTAEEISLLKEVYPIYGRSKVLLDKFPGRNLNAICLKANRLGLKTINAVTKARTNEEYVKFLELNTDFVPLEVYKGSTVPIMHLCGICDHEWKTRPQALMKPGAKCPACDLKTRKNSFDKVLKVLESADLDLLSEYIGALSSITVRHKSCGHVWDTKYSYIQQGSGCPVCNKGFGYFDKEHYPDKAVLYVLEVIFFGGYRYLKVGITSRPLARRINEISSSIGDDLLLIKPVILVRGDGKSVIQLEQRILHDESVEKVCSIKKFSGSTELVSEHSLETINELINKDKNVTIIQTSYG